MTMTATQHAQALAKLNAKRAECEKGYQEGLKKLNREKYKEEIRQYAKARGISIRFESTNPEAAKAAAKASKAALERFYSGRR